MIAAYEAASGRPRESWLALDNENHDQFAAAMLLCEDASGSCVHTGQCSFDGDCFKGGGEAEREAAKKIETLARSEDGLVSKCLFEVASKLRQDANLIRRELSAKRVTFEN